MLSARWFSYRGFMIVICIIIFVLLVYLYTLRMSGSSRQSTNNQSAQVDAEDNRIVVSCKIARFDAIYTTGSKLALPSKFEVIVTDIVHNRSSNVIKPGMTIKIETRLAIMIENDKLDAQHIISLWKRAPGDLFDIRPTMYDATVLKGLQDIEYIDIAIAMTSDNPIQQLRKLAASTMSGRVRDAALFQIDQWEKRQSRE